MLYVISNTEQLAKSTMSDCTKLRVHDDFIFFLFFNFFCWFYGNNDSCKLLEIESIFWGIKAEIGTKLVRVPYCQTPHQIMETD